MTDTTAAAGPPLETLTRRLIDTPADFLAAPIIVGRGEVDTAAVVSDLLADLGAAGLDTAAANAFRPAEDTSSTRNWLGSVLVTAWLLHDDSFVGIAPEDRVMALLTGDVADLAAIVPAASLVTDPDRREELARRCLRALRFVPAGETGAQASDRLAALDSVERARVLAATRDAELRAAEVRQALHAKRAAEAAAKASRE